MGSEVVETNGRLLPVELSYEAYRSYRRVGSKHFSQIPEHWRMTQVKYLGFFQYGDSLSQEDREDGPIPVYGSNGIVGWHSEPNTAAPCLIVGRKGSFGKINYSESPCFSIDTTYYIDEKTANSDIRWFYYALQILNLDHFSQDSAVPGLSREYAHSRRLPHPPLGEQRAIVAFLDRETAKIDSLIEKKQRLIELLEEKRTALISHAVTKGLDPDAPVKDSGVEWLGEIPEHWDVRSLKYVAKVELSNVDKKKVEGEKEVRLCNYTDVYYGEYLEDDPEFMVATATEDEIAKFSLQEGDVLITKDSETADDIAVPAFAPFDMHGVLCGYHLAQIRPNSFFIESEYLFRSFQARRIAHQFEVEATGITRYGISKSAIQDATFLVPPTSEQREIAKHLRTETQQIDVLKAKIQEAIDLLQEYRTSIISAAVTGKIDVRDEGEVPA